jgi:hypothetical protein
MSTQPPAELLESADRSRLTAMIDKLVAVQLDLKPMCDEPGNRVQEKTAQTTIAEACDVLQSAIEDLRQVIFRLDGFSDLVELPPSPMQGGSE